MDEIRGLGRGDPAVVATAFQAASRLSNSRHRSGERPSRRMSYARAGAAPCRAGDIFERLHHRGRVRVGDQALHGGLNVPSASTDHRSARQAGYGGSRVG